jgi:hypothetical protein
LSSLALLAGQAQFRYLQKGYAMMKLAMAAALALLMAAPAFADDWTSF